MADRDPRWLVPWDPFEEFDPFARWPFRSSVRPARLLESAWGTRRGFAPVVDVSEDDDHYTVTAELPGVKKDDVTIELHERVLTIHGEKRSEREEKTARRHHVERSFGAFSRSFTLPANADPDQIRARFEEGVLTVEIRKMEEAKPRTVTIKG